MVHGRGYCPAAVRHRKEYQTTKIRDWEAITEAWNDIPKHNPGLIAAMDQLTNLYASGRRFKLAETSTWEAGRGCIELWGIGSVGRRGSWLKPCNSNGIVQWTSALLCPQGFKTRKSRSKKDWKWYSGGMVIKSTHMEKLSRKWADFLWALRVELDRMAKEHG